MCTAMVMTALCHAATLGQCSPQHQYDIKTMRCNHDLGPAASIDVLCEMCCFLNVTTTHVIAHFQGFSTITVSLHVSYAVELCKPVPFSTWSKVRNMSMGWLYLHQT
ncbi:hypothetical protein CC77DRAFT_448634 [Alternaria alternata]|uniref:Secreted protein n=1 Tax=Alternaria alternata TaxID=5599 RepID=A0A177D9B8_ALTAL|nr:hypothetical protein CC77DRAFT_448634 [Alternaria alternata]OAG15529.1 hypothetical protein CC77DRAFT_448634 [Alternaria alternata]